MKVIGFSAGSTGREGNVDRMVKAILDKSGHETEFIKLTDVNFSGCKGCVNLCARPQVCTLDDDALPFFEKVKQADAVVLGTPVYFGTVSATIWAFVERFYGYRHVDIPIANKPFVTVISGAKQLDNAVTQLNQMLGMFNVNVLDTVAYSSKTPPCYRCGRHKECEIGGLYMMHGDVAKEMKITKDMFKRWEDDAAAGAAVARAAERLRAI